MKKRIFLSICFASLISVLLSSVFIGGVIYRNSENEIKTEIRNEAFYLAHTLEFIGCDTAYLSDTGENVSNRITLIDTDGTVLYDNYAEENDMTNHMSRPEVADAAANGTGEAVRYSNTVGEKTYYYAVRLSDGTIVRIANTSKTVYGVIRNAVGWIILISILVLIVAVVIAYLLSRSIIKPINNLNIDSPLSNNTYEELSPLLRRMDKHNAEIASKIRILKEKQNELDYITSSMSEGLVIFSETGNILSANASAGRILKGQTEGSYLMLSRDADYISCVESALKGKASTKKMKTENKVYSLSASPVANESKDYAAVLFIVDITDRELAEQMRREFTANVSHELKTPLTSILGYAEIISNGIAKPEDINGFAGRIYSEASRLMTLIQDIIHLSRLDEGELRHEFEKVNLSEVCKKAVNDLSEKAKAAKITLNEDIDDIVINGYEPVLYEIVFNLCDNAIIYNKPEGSVSVSLKSDSSKAILTVSDTGIGIAPEHQARIFERFYRVDKSRSKETGGTGLGLSIVKHGAMLHDAEIAISSKPDKGTSISITFNI